MSHSQFVFLVNVVLIQQMPQYISLSKATILEVTQVNCLVLW